MFIARDSESINNQWLTLYENKWVWGKKREEAYQFQTKDGALIAGKVVMPSPTMESRVVVELV